MSIDRREAWRRDCCRKDSCKKDPCKKDPCRRDPCRKDDCRKDDCRNDCCEKKPCPCQTHVHEFLGSTMLAEPPRREDLRHNHRYAGVTGPVKENPENPGFRCHFHIICINTDFTFGHFHRIEIMTGPPVVIYDECGKPIGHIHPTIGETSCNLNHVHMFKGTTLIESPIDPIPCDSYDD